MPRISIESVVYFLAALLGTAALSAQGGPPAGPSADVDIPTLLAEMVDRESVARSPSVPFTLVSKSGTSRAEQRASTAREGSEPHDDPESPSTPRVLARFEGPGAMVRLYVGRASGWLIVHADDAVEPIIKMEMTLFTKGQIEVFKPPFSTPMAKGFVLSFPVPFAKSLEISTDGAEFPFEVDCRIYPKTTTVETFAMKPAVFSQYMNPEGVAAFFAAHQPDEPQPPAAAGVVHPPADATVDVKPASSVTILEKTIAGGGVIRSLSFERFLPLLNYEGMQRLRLVGEFDGAATFDVPFSELFAELPEFVPTRGWRIVREEPIGGILRRRTLHFPMPFAKSAVLRVVNDGPADSGDLRFFFDVEAQPWDDRTEHFHVRSDGATLAFHRVRDAFTMAPLPSSVRLVGEIYRCDADAALAARGLTVGKKHRSLGSSAAEHFSIATEVAPLAGTMSNFVGAASLSENQTTLVRMRHLDVRPVEKGRRLGYLIPSQGADSAHVRTTIFFYRRP